MAAIGMHTLMTPKRQRVPARHCACELHVRRHRFSFATSVQTVPVAHFTALEHGAPSATTGSCFTMHNERAESQLIVSGQGCEAEHGCEQ